MRRSVFLLPALGTLALVLCIGAPAVLPEYYADLLSKIMIFAILAVSMELILGTTGLVSLGQAAFFGVGAYVVVLMQKHFGVSQLLVVLPLAVLAAAAAGFVVGALSLRTKGIYFIMTTLAFAQMFFHFAHDTPLVGGSDGMYLSHPVWISLAGQSRWQLTGTRPVYWVTLAVLVACLAGAAILLNSHFGRALRGIGSNEQRMRAIGYAPYPYKLGIFVVAAALSGLAGFLFCAKNGAVNPEMLAWQQSGVVLLMVIMGGVGRLWGAVSGAAIYVLLQETLSSEVLMGRLAEHWLLLFGVAVIVIVALWPMGFAGQIARLLESRRPGAGASDA